MSVIGYGCCCSNYVDFCHAKGNCCQDFRHRVTKLTACLTYSRKSTADTLIYLHNIRKMSAIYRVSQKNYTKLIKRNLKLITSTNHM